MNRDKELDKLLDLYTNQEAAPNEEQELMAMLDEIAEEHMPEGLETRLEALIESFDAEENSSLHETPVVQLRPKHNHLLLNIRKYSIAACAIILLAVGLIFNQLGNKTSFSDTCSTPAEAQEQMMLALTMLSSHSHQSMNSALELLEQPVTSNNLNKYIDFE